jgi:outer membrane lipoprotein SlyB
MQLPPAPKKARGRNGLWLAIIVLGIAAFAMFGLKQPALVVNSVDMEGPFAGDGKPHSVVLRYTAHNNVLRSVETRFVRGDGTWDTRPATYDISASDGAPGQAAVQTLSYTTSKPASVTFSYVLIGGDGKRSAPFEHTFNIVPPPQITDLTVPRSLHVGADFSVTLNYQRGASDIVKVERHVINSNVPWGQNDAEQTTQLKDTTGSFNYAFSAAQQPVRSTVEFVIEDAQGIRSEPKRVVLNIGATNVASPNAPSPSTPSPSAPSPSTPNVRDARGRPATVVAVREVRAPGQSTGMGGAIGAMLGAIAGSKLGHGRGRAPTAVIGAGGGALAGNAVESNARATVTWQTTVQFDDGSRRVFTQTDAPRWRAGDRVNAVNGVLSVP